MSVSHELVAGRYRLVRQLGAGGMGRVWLARDEMLHRDVAVKEVVPPEGLSDEENEELRERTLREARTTARLNHPHVVQIYDVVQTEQWPWIVMEYVRSRSLHQIIKQNGPLTPQRVAQIGLAVLAALRAAHAAGVLHRDIKPANVLLSDDGRVVLTDFGLATFDGVESAVTRPGLVLGTALYVAPERARDGSSSPEADLWSLGATLYAAVEGRSPYARPTTLATLTALATEPPDPARNAGPLRPVLSGLLRRNPRARLAPAEAQKLLERVAAGQVKPRPWLAPRPRAPRAAAPAEALGSELMPAGGASGSGVTPPALSSATLATPAAATDLLLSGSGSDGTQRDGVHADGGEGLVGVGLADDGSGSGGQTNPTESLRPPRWRIWVLAGLLVALIAAPAWAVFSAERGSRPPAEAASNSAEAAVPPSWLTKDAGLCRQTFAVPQSTDRPPASSPLPSRPGQAREYAPPAGWGYYRQSDGLRIVAPNAWAYARTTSMICFRDPTRVLGVQTGWSPGGDVTEGMRRLEEQLLLAHDLPGYSSVGMVPKPYYYASSAEWEFTFTGEDGDMLRVRMRGVVTESGQGYLIFLLTQELDKPFLDTNWGSILGGFAPAKP